MNATAEIDKAGRLVVPKKLREALHLVPGTRVTLHKEGDSLILQPETQPRGLYMDRGTLVYDSGPQPSIDVLKWMEEDREARVEELINR